VTWPLEPERKASYAFHDRMLREDDRAFVASFDITVQMLQGLTNSRELLSAAFDQLRITERVSTLLFYANHQTSGDPMRKQKGRKAFILLSDASMSAARPLLAPPSNSRSVPIP
jgi:hypothetical protein